MRISPKSPYQAAEVLAGVQRCTGREWLSFQVIRPSTRLPLPRRPVAFSRRARRFRDFKEQKEAFSRGKDLRLEASPPILIIVTGFQRHARKIFKFSQIFG